MRTTTLALATALTIGSVVLGLVASAPSVSALSPNVDQFDIVAPPGSGDEFAEDGILVLSNGNFVIADPQFSSPTVDEIGAVYLYDGRTNELISTLTGSNEGDQVGETVEDLGNGSFAVSSGPWDLPDGTQNVGAVTVVDAVTGLDGVVTTANSLHGTQPGDEVGRPGSGC